jgi:hypothetical protein
VNEIVKHVSDTTYEAARVSVFLTENFKQAGKKKAQH